MTSADRCRWSLIALATVAGCFDPTYNNARCDPTGACPSGFHCEGTTCVVGDGEDGDTPPPAETARQLFERTVKPLLNLCASCHVGPATSSTSMFLGPDGLDSAYNTLVKDRAVNGGFDPAVARLLTKGGHEGPAWSSSQTETIATWLRAELAERGPVGPDPGTGARSARTALVMFASCMSVSLAEFNTTKAYQIATMNTQEQGVCIACHFGLDVLATWQQEAYFVGLFTAAVQPDLTYKVVAAEAKICDKGNENQSTLGAHPAYDCHQNNSTALNALKAFAAMVQAKVELHDPSCPTLAMFMPPAPPLR